jgi:hypothetical protein
VSVLLAVSHIQRLKLNLAYKLYSNPRLVFT